MTRLSCQPPSGPNQVRLWLSLIAYNLGNLWRRLALPKLVKNRGSLIKNARYYWLLLAESDLTRRLFGGMLRRIATVASPAG